MSKDLGKIKPISSASVQVPSAYLSFDHRGIPYLEPCYTSAIISGVNDDEFNSFPTSSIEYAESIWSRCCPGMEFSGQLPPLLEVR